MSSVKEIIVATIIPMVKEVGKLELKDVLSQIKAHNTPELYHNTLQGLYSDFSLLKEVTVKTKTKIDDGLVDLVLEAVTETAAADGIVLS
jgi:hypothetical protein